LGGIVASEVGVLGEGDGLVTEDIVEVVTRPGGAGSFVVALADPGRTMGLESLMGGLVTSARVL
jgi:hypothetical protein